MPWLCCALRDPQLNSKNSPSSLKIILCIISYRIVDQAILTKSLSSLTKVNHALSG